MWNVILKLLLKILYQNNVDDDDYHDFEQNVPVKRWFKCATAVYTYDR